MDRNSLIDTIRDSSLATTERGNALEDLICAILTDFEVSHKMTKRSGALHGDGDILVRNNITIDGKVKGRCMSVSITKAELLKVMVQASKTDRTGMIATFLDYQEGGSHQHDSDVYVTLRLRDLLQLLPEEY